MRRVTTLLLATPVGLATGLAAWLAAGGYSAHADQLALTEARLAALHAAPRNRTAAAMPSQVADLVAAPIFPMTVGPGAVTEPLVRLVGVSVSPHRRAALLAIGEAAPDWLLVGESRDGVTLQQVNGSKVAIETLVGSREVALGDVPAAEPLAQPTPRPVPAAPGPSAPGPRPLAALPPGPLFRSPPPPASAPGHP